MTTEETGALSGDALSIAVLVAKGAEWERNPMPTGPDDFLMLGDEQVAIRGDTGGLLVSDDCDYATSIAAAETLLDELPAGYTYTLQSWRDRRVWVTIHSPSGEFIWQGHGDPKTDAKPLAAAISRAYIAYLAATTPALT